MMLTFEGTRIVRYLTPVLASALLFAGPAAAGDKAAGRADWGAGIKNALPAPAPLPPATPPAAASTPSSPITTGALPSAPQLQRTQLDLWMLECPATKSATPCTLRQTVNDGKQRRIIELVATRSGAIAYLEVAVPLGIAIPYGVALELAPGVKLGLQLVDCNPAGCRAVVRLDAGMIAKIQSAKSLSVVFQDSKSGKILSIGGSPKGFAEGMKRVLPSS
jgi:invasion protein IalB